MYQVAKFSECTSWQMLLAVWGWAINKHAAVCGEEYACLACYSLAAQCKCKVCCNQL